MPTIHFFYGLDGNVLGGSLIGTVRRDSIGVFPSMNRLYGGNGNDTLSGGSSNDTLDGGADIDTMTYAAEAATQTIIGLPQLARKRPHAPWLNKVWPTHSTSIENVIGQRAGEIYML